MNPSRLTKARSDEVFNELHKEFIKLDIVDKKRNNEYLHLFIGHLIECMGKEDQLFEYCYQNIMYSGSFYKGLKVESPDEFDLDLIIKLPFDYGKLKFEVNQHDRDGYVSIRVPETAYDRESLVWKMHRIKLMRMVQGEFFDHSEFRKWVEDVLEKAMTRMTKIKYECATIKFIINLTKNPTAFKLSIKRGFGTEELMSIDLVPCLQFNVTSDLLKFYRDPRTIHIQINTWMAIASSIPPENKLWRVSFAEQEKEFLAKHGQFKPVIRMLKKLRDTKKWFKLSSYCIETLCVRELVDNLIRWNYEYNSKNQLFIHMLGVLLKSLEDCDIPYFWKSNVNLLKGVDRTEIKEYAVVLRSVIDDVKKNPQSITAYIH